MALAERRRRGKPLTRPELAVLLAYAKLALYDDLLHSSVPDDPYLARELAAYFPPVDRERFPDALEQHRLRREIIATSLANSMINRGGPISSSASPGRPAARHADIAYAFAAVMAVYALPEVYAGIDALDGRIDGQRQLSLYREVQELLCTQTAWFLRHGLSEESLEPEIERYREGVAYLAGNLTAALPAAALARHRAQEQRLRDEGLPPELAGRIAALGPLAQALDAVRVARTMNVPIPAAAHTIFAIREGFHLDELASASATLAGGDYYERLAVNSSLATVASAQRALARRIIEHPVAKGDFEAWRKEHEHAAGRVAASLAGMLGGRGLSLAKLTVGVAQLRDLAAI